MEMYPFRLAASRQATLPLLSLRDIFPRNGEVVPQGDGFSSGGKVSGIAIRRPLGGAGCERSEQAEGVSSLQTSSPSPSLLRKSTSPKGRGLGKEMKFAWTAKGSPFGRAVTAGD